MDPSNDIRRLHDVARAPAAVAWLLQNRPPPTCSDEDIEYDTTGLDCLLIVLRMLYSVQLPIYASNDDRLRAAEARNPALRLAWQNYTYESGASRIHWAMVKKEVLDAFRSHEPDLFDANEPHSLDTSFEKLVGSRLMEETFWCRPEYRLYQHPLVKIGSNWFVRILSNTSPLNLEPITIDRSNIRDFPEPTFQEHVDEHFGSFEHDGSKMLHICNEPPIIRIRYMREPRGDVFPFSTIKNIRIPVADIDGSTCTEVARRPYYTLIAAVALRDYQGYNPHDLVRTYSPMAHQLIPMPSHPVLDGGDWTLEMGESEEFMLFYLYMGNVEPHEGYGEFIRSLDHSETVDSGSMGLWPPRQI
ncbi:hypothetical protein CEP54_009260 [Fusarium duplospermum]|uniref:Uncharacterized protein n=1 Tax=Fusarium duplospermum TaxID=1325734 RepID=A0A428PRM7_9HYPO|nr:hypothetical protein CEP54_009260 [Fusarium duplospermum]